MKANKATGVDDFSIELLKNASKNVKVWLLKFFNIINGKKESNLENGRNNLFAQSIKTKVIPANAEITEESPSLG